MATGAEHGAPDAGGRSHGDPGEAPRGGPLALLAVGAAGVVFGDIATNVLFVFRAAYAPEHRIAVTAPSVLGICSLILWALLLVVTVKYVGVVMRASHRGEGGILALLSLIAPQLERGRARFPAVWIAAALLGAALLYGDGVITPAISVLSAVEGLRVASPAFDPFVLPLTVALLVALFALQRRGTGRIGALFGPVMLLWLLTIAVLGARQIAARPDVLLAFDPRYAVRFFAANGWHAVLVLGAVTLAVAGAEALYADMGHFGRRPIAIDWLVVVMPCLMLDYLGQGALLLRDPAAVANPLFLLAPRWLVYPLVALASAATIIASQSLVSGAFSLTRQLMHLGYSPLLRVTHTSRSRVGQIYIPEVNALLMAGSVALVLGFRSSDRLAAAYGLAVSGAMGLTTLLFYHVARWCWGWTRARAGAVTAGFLAIDTALLVANVAKIPRGGWVPLVIAGAVYLLFVTWKRGQAGLIERRRAEAMPLPELFARIDEGHLCRTPGTGVFLSRREEAPSVLRQQLEQIGALHERLVLLAVIAAPTDRVQPSERVSVEPLTHGLVRVLARYGYMQSVTFRDIVDRCAAAGVTLSAAETTFYVSRERVRPTGPLGMARWRKRLFIFLDRNAPRLQDFFALPAHRVVEMGRVVEL